MRYGLIPIHLFDVFKPLITHQPHRCHFLCIIGASIIYNNTLPMPVCLRQHTFKRIGQVLGLVVAGDDDADKWILIHYVVFLS